jgi:hypothetical protein
MLNILNIHSFDWNKYSDIHIIFPYYILIQFEYTFLYLNMYSCIWTCFYYSYICVHSIWIYAQRFEYTFIWNKYSDIHIIFP